MVTDKEIALDLAKSYLTHLNTRAQSPNHTGAYIDAKGVASVYKHFLSVVEGSVNPLNKSTQESEKTPDS